MLAKGMLSIHDIVSLTNQTLLRCLNNTVLNQTVDRSMNQLKVGSGVVVVLLLGLVASGASGLAVMSVDIGSEWMKVAVVSVGFFHKYSLNLTETYIKILAP